MMRPTETRESRAFVLEMKFLITPACADEIRAWARGHMLPDPHAGGEGGDSYRVTSLYLDTPDLAVYERRGSYARSKYRVRRYGESGLVFLERKLKTRNRVGKLRSVVPVEEMAWLEGGEAPRGWAGRWFHCFCHGISRCSRSPAGNAARSTRVWNGEKWTRTK